MAGEYQHNWHIDALCEHLEAVSKGQINRLIINLPPGVTKSLITSVAWPSWEWSFNPSCRFIYGSFSERNVLRDARRHRDIVCSDWFSHRFGKDAYVDTKAVQYFINHAKGFRYSTTIGGAVTGEHAHRQVVDDPIKPQDVSGGKAVTRSMLDAVHNWWTGTMATRRVDPKHFSRVIVMQRLHPGDLAGLMLETGDYEHLMLPMLFEPQRRCHTSIGFSDPRTKENELLWPDRYDENAVSADKKEMGSFWFETQHQQRPSAKSGLIFKQQWIEKTYDVIPVRARYFMSIDPVLTSSDSGSYHVNILFAYHDGNYYIVSVDRHRGYTSTEDENSIVSMANENNPSPIYLEKTARGASLSDTLKAKISSIELVTPLGDKETRARAVTGHFETGCVFLPKQASWLMDFRRELLEFPTSPHDDQVDALSQGIYHYEKSHRNDMASMIGALSQRNRR